ncbi:MFS general substrate transporter [Paramyrothecium foliicola]|nr:MFS general substrate transporter [Paramyrothecium foliicola]
MPNVKGPERIVRYFHFTIPDNSQDIKILLMHSGFGFAAPEALLPPCLVGCAAPPVSLFLVTWTSHPSAHFMVSIISGIPFGFGIVLVFLLTLNYLINSYTILSRLTQGYN